SESLLGLRLDKNYRSLSAYALERKEEIVVNNFDTPQPFEVGEPIRKNGIKSGMCVILYGGREPIGTLLVHTNRERTFDESDVYLLKVIANEVGKAIEAEKKRSNLEGIYKALSAIVDSSRGLETSKIYAQILSQAMQCVEQKASLACLISFD